MDHKKITIFKKKSSYQEFLSQLVFSCSTLSRIQIPEEVIRTQRIPKVNTYIYIYEYIVIYEYIINWGNNQARKTHVEGCHHQGTCLANAQMSPNFSEYVVLSLYSPSAALSYLRSARETLFSYEKTQAVCLLCSCQSSSIWFTPTLNPPVVSPLFLRIYFDQRFPLQILN